MKLSQLEAAGFDVAITNHALAILTRDFPGEFGALCAILLDTHIPCTELLQGGGGEAPPTRNLRKRLNAAGWNKRVVRITKAVDGVEKASTTHEIDHVRDCEHGTLALEIEWNNKDPFYDRDLENFQRLHAEGAISVGIVVTRGKSLQEEMRDILAQCAKANGLRSADDLERLGIKAFTANQDRQLEKLLDEQDYGTAVALMIAGKYGESTTHWRKLTDRIDRGVGNPCPLLLIGLPASCVQIT